MGFGDAEEIREPARQTTQTTAERAGDFRNIPLGVAEDGPVKMRYSGGVTLGQEAVKWGAKTGTLRVDKLEEPSQSGRGF